jgi:hypothetical protein
MDPVLDYHNHYHPLIALKRIDPVSQVEIEYHKRSYYQKAYSTISSMIPDLSDYKHKRLLAGGLIKSISELWKYFGDNDLFSSFRSFINIYDGCNIWIHKKQPWAICSKWTLQKEIVDDYYKVRGKPYEIWQEVFDGMEDIETKLKNGNPFQNIMLDDVSNDVFDQAKTLLTDKKFNEEIRAQRVGQGKSLEETLSPVQEGGFLANRIMQKLEDLGHFAKKIGLVHKEAQAPDATPDRAGVGEGLKNEEVYKPPISITDNFSVFKTKNSGTEYSLFKSYFRNLLATNKRKAVNDLINCTRAGRWLKKECYENVLELSKSTFMKIQKESNPATKNTKRR